MSQAKKAKPKKKKELAKRQEKNDQVRPSQDESDNIVDYGGMPDRNFKKNLGCG